MTPFIVAEAGLNHDGSEQRAFDLVEAAKRAGADAVKFQTYVPERILRRSDPDFETLARLALPFETFGRISAHCEAVGIEFMSTPGDLDSLRFLVDECRVKRIKIGSDDLLNEPLVQAAYRTRLPVILSTGMASLADIDKALFGASRITLLHCVSLYPCPYDKANLRAITTMRKRYSWDNIDVGYSDHTEGTMACVAAAALGASMIEKHIRALGTNPIDLTVSIHEEEFRDMVCDIQDVAEMLGDGVKLPSAEERDAARKLRKGADGLRGVA